MDYSFKQGEDKTIVLEVLLAGAQVDVSTATKIKGNFNINGETAKIYALAPSANEGVIELEGVDNWKLNLFVERIDSKLFDVGVITIVLVIEFTDATYPDGNEVTEYEFSVGSVQEGKAKDIVL